MTYYRDIVKTDNQEQHQQERSSIRFYTYTPKYIEYPYLLVNPRNRKVLKRRKWSHAILDCGVLVFRDPEVREYPQRFLEEWKYTAKLMADMYGDRIWVTIPDYPDDINPGQFGDNVKKTVENIEEFISIDGVNWLISLQSRYLNIFTFTEAIQAVKDRVGDYPRIAIGTVCKTNKLSFITKSCKLARKHFPHSHLHAFGLTLSALPKLADTLNSFDSTAWTFPRKRGQGMCSAKEERIEYFNAYLNRIKNLIGAYSIDLATTGDKSRGCLDRLGTDLEEEEVEV